MFAAATQNFVTQVGSNGRLVAVPSLNEADRYHPLNLVTKKRRAWLWQKAKHSSTSFALKDILVGEKDIDIDVTSYQLVNYEDESDGAPGRRERHGSEGVLAGVGFSVARSENVAVHASLGIVTKHELDVPLLLRLLRNRRVDVEHWLVRQTRASGRAVLCIVAESIRTTRQCSLAVRTSLEQKLRVHSHRSRARGRAAEEGVRQGKGRDKTIVIPAHTTVAFSVFELYIRLDGSFELCVAAELPGGFEREETLGERLRHLVARLAVWRGSSSPSRSLRAAPEGRTSPSDMKGGYRPSSRRSSTADTTTVDFYEQTATLTDLSGPSGVGASSTSNVGGRGGGFPPEEPGAHQRVNLLHQGVSKGPCALCGLGARPRDTVYGCVECAWGGHKYVRLHAVPCFDLWHRKMKS
ncbi:pejvakin [Petromyzon marinus]|uniref:pejvakin n=1 Tax=Petromyzon marinus TaxID=7757 RepID=UPI003F70BCC1